MRFVEGIELVVVLRLVFVGDKFVVKISIVDMDNVSRSGFRDVMDCGCVVMVIFRWLL